jgi:Ca2+-binding EF-hand superfamily protein
MKVERRFLNQELLKDARAAFNILDHESAGSIDLRDLRVALRALGWDSSKEEGRRIIHDIELKESDGVLKQRIIDGMMPFSLSLGFTIPQVACHTKHSARFLNTN